MKNKDTPRGVLVRLSAVLSVYQALSEDVCHRISTGHNDGCDLSYLVLGHAKCQEQRSNEAHQGDPELAGSQFLSPVDHSRTSLNVAHQGGKFVIDIQLRIGCIFYFHVSTAIVEDSSVRLICVECAISGDFGFGEGSFDGSSKLV